MPTLRSVFTLAALLSFAASVSAQWNVSQVTFRNAGSRSQAALEQAAGMHAGQKVTRAEIQAAAQRLMDSGYFDDVKVDSKGAPGPMEIIFILSPEPLAKETPAGFDNFVWFTPDELQAVVRKAAPLFNGRLPEAGNEADLISEGLQSALAARGLNNRVVSETLQPSTNKPSAVTDFRVEPAPRIAAVDLTGVPPDLNAAENKAIAGLTFTAYNEGASADTTANVLLAPERDAGYLEAKLENVERVVDAAGRVDVSATLVPGPVYRVSAMNMPAGDLAPLLKDALRAGEIASRERLLLTLAPMEAAYRKQGYMDAYINPGETLDTAAHTVSYKPVVVPGEIYHLHSVSASGLPPVAQAQFDQAWTLHPGDVYDADYVNHFIENNSALTALSKYKGTFKAEADPSTRLVDLKITFVPNSLAFTQ